MDNRNVKIKKYKKLRDAIHDIVTKLNKDEWIDIDGLSIKLKKFNINISSDALNKILLNWKENKDYIVFEPNDIDWLYYDEKDKYVFNTLSFYKPPVLGKSKDKIKKEEIKELKKKREKEKETIVENIEKIEKKTPIVCPVSTQVILNSFKGLDELDVLKIKRFIEKSINNNNIKNIYEEAWEYMVNNVPKGYLDGGLGFELSNSYQNYKLSKRMVIPELKDIDIYVRIWHYKYGYGIIDYIFNDYMSIDFDNISFIKRLKMESSINNKSVRVDKSYIKRPIPLDNNKYEYAYLNDLSKGDSVYHVKRGIGEVDENFKYNNKDIRFIFNDVKVKMSKRQFLKDQNVFKPKKEKILKNFNLFNNNNNNNNNNNSGNDFNNDKTITGWDRIQNVNEFEKGMTVKYNNDVYIVDDIYGDNIVLKSAHNNNTTIWKTIRYIRAGIYKKVNWIEGNLNQLRTGMVIKYKKDEWLVDEIDTSIGNTYIGLKNSMSSMFLPLRSLENKFYIKNDI